MEADAVHQHPDRRVWLDTDRPGERMTLSLQHPGVRVLSVSGSDRHCTELHEAHTLCVLHAGQPGIGAEWRSGRATGSLETCSGGVMVMEIGEVHRTTRVHGKVSFSVVQIEPAVVMRVAEQLDLAITPRVRATSVSSPELQRALMNYVAATAGALESRDPEDLLTDLIATWLRLCSERGAGPSPICVTRPRDPVVHRGIRRARDAIRDRACSTAGVLDCPRLRELAALSGLSLARFPHAFKEWLGMSPHAYFNVCRLNGARRALEHGASPTDAAAAFGFADLPHFSRRFRRQFGVSPRAWSQLSRAGGTPRR